MVWKEVKELATGWKRGGKAPSEPPPGSGGGAGPLKVGGPGQGAPSGMGGGSSGSSKALTVNEFVARTKRVREQERTKGEGGERQELGCTKQELVAYARYLGMDPVVDGDLVWIAEQALEAPLPSEWTEHHDSADRVFYYNVQTHASSWTHPLEQLHRDTYKQIIGFRSGDMPSDEQKVKLKKLQVECEDSEKKAHVELQAWTEHTDEQGQKFYYNRDKQTSVWTDPRPARCHCLYLQMKAVKVLGKHCGVSDDVKDLGGTPAPLGAGGGALDSDDLEHRKKQKRKKHRDREEANSMGGILTASKDSGKASDADGGMDIRRQGKLVEEARAALLTENGGGSSVLPGDGLKMKGRAKITPGIRLDPILS